MSQLNSYLLEHMETVALCGKGQNLLIAFSKEMMRMICRVYFCR